MSTTARRLSRLLSMLPWVIAHPGTTVDELCERFGYSRGELLSDLNLVFVCGLPGYGPGDLMEAYVDDDEVTVDLADYFSSSVRLTPTEALGLLAAGMALLSSGQAGPALESAVDKLSRVVLGDQADVIFVELPAEPEMVSLLRTAASDHRVVELTYTSLGKGETTDRSVEPWTVFSSLGNWYLTAHCRRAGAERIFRVDRIRAARMSTESFEPPEDIPEPAVGYTPSQDDIRATIRLGPAAQWVADYYPVDVVRRDTKGMVVRFSAPDPSVPARLLVRLGADAELLDGEETERETETLRRLILARYEGSEPDD